MTGLSTDDIVGRTREEVMSARGMSLDGYEALSRAVGGRQRFENVEVVWDHGAERRVYSLGGKPVFDGADRFEGYRGTGRDVTSTHELTRQMVYQASHDGLTGLVNRREFELRLGRVLQSASADDSEHALCYVDLDQFKVINDTCGHIAGDQLLKQLGGLLQGETRKRDTLARLGGDEFGLLMEHCSMEQAHRVANSLRRAIMSFRFSWEGRMFSIGASVGLVPIDGSENSITDVQSAADQACYAAKERGGGQVQIYRRDDRELARRQGEMRWVARLNDALDQGLFRLLRQPIVSVDDAVAGRRSPGRETMSEILLRLHDPELGETMPGAFMPAAERYGLTTRIDQWVIANALERIAEALRERRTTYFINLSGPSLADESIHSFIIQRLEALQIEPKHVCFELTETNAIANLSGATRLMNALKKHGCRFALDDFGSGLSSFGYLKSLPADFVKIDGTFVNEIDTDGVSFAMVRSINDLAHVMDKQTIAEGVEGRRVLECLAEIGVDYVQGYHIARPVEI